MTAININITATLAQSNLKELESKLKNLKPVMSSIGEYMVRRTRQRFDSETSPDGVKWAPLAEATIAAKRERRTNAPPTAILKSTFTLRDTIAYVPTETSVKIGTPQEYGKFHQYGTRRIPARPFLGYNQQDLKEIEEIFVDALELLT